jgi:competence protein ComGC
VIVGLPAETFVGVIIVPVIISLLLLIWAIRWE